ncbi:MAG: TetR/AcrR family transcriptional regulator [Chloroflexi bacterium]|nr:TetR/AcrR family transcriptional regulator [Chloroflexota bacterium]
MADKQDERRQQILMAALEAFTTKGYDKTSMDDIVRASGLSKGTLYWYFNSKPELFAALFEMTTAQMLAAFDSVLSGTEALSPPEALRGMLDGLADAVETNPVFSLLTIDFILQALHHAEIQAKISMYYQGYIRRLAAVLHSGIDQGYFIEVDVHAFATGLLSAMDGVSMLALLLEGINALNGYELRMRDVITSFGDVMIRGLMKGDKDAR